MTHTEPSIRVEVVRAGPREEVRALVQLPTGATVEDALRESCASIGIREWQSLAGQVGIFGQHCGFDRSLKDGDRVELYRPLHLDAKAARRNRARRGPTSTR